MPGTDDPLYFLYSLKMNGWLTSGGSYVDNIEMAQTFEIQFAISRVTAHYDQHSKQFMLIPVNADIMALRS